MAVTGKTGADAVAIAIKHICRVVSAYNLKLRAVIAQSVTAGSITAGDAAVLIAWLDGLVGVCAIWEAVALYSGF